jgi:DDE domain
VSEQDANNRIEADHGRLKARLRPMRGMNTILSMRLIAAGHAFVQNLRRGHYEITNDRPCPGACPRWIRRTGTVHLRPPPTRPTRTLPRFDQATVPRGRVSGTAPGRLYGAPATKHRDQASFIDYVRLDQRRIVEQVQQADVLARMCQLYGRVLGVAGITTTLLRQHPRTATANPHSNRNGRPARRPPDT